MKVLITGGYGFIGSHIAERFHKEGHGIFIIDDLSAGETKNIGFPHSSLICGIEDDSCEDFFRTHSFDAVIHCAAQTSVQYSISSPKKDAETNVLGLVNMLDLSTKYGVKKFAFCSSAAVYGDNPNLPLKETETPDPLSPYGISKMNGEFYCLKWAELYGMEALVYRFSNVYGPRQQISAESGVITIFAEKLLAGEPITVYGDGRQTRDFVYVGDVAEAMYRGIMDHLSGVYNLSGNTETTIRELIGMMAGNSPEVPIVYETERTGDIRQSRLDHRKLKKALGWVPSTSLEDGLASLASANAERMAFRTHMESSSGGSKELPV
ncbi:NAD-dependent epimerase/dehydratase family protein [Bhargavaea ullalensis]|uniref:Nucleoside-diphosphate-sugar epimerase n=1 Tax=Bhargavaea ullalensis TaxID=1265685 RepID=A0ABV2GE94_9BACL